MKIIVPLARKDGASEEFSSASYLIGIAGKPLISHLTAQVLALKPEEVIFIVGDEEREIILALKEAFPSLRCRFIKQRQSKGSAHAIYGARSMVQGEVFVLFGDTLFTADLSGLSGVKGDGVIWTQEVKDPREFGVVFLDGFYASRLIEKPDAPVATKAMVGLYYFKDAAALFESIGHLLEHKIMTKGSFTLTDAMGVMINRGKRFLTREVSSWTDIGKEGGILEASRTILASQGKVLGSTEKSVIIPPVHIGKGAKVSRSVIGPYVSIAEGASVTESVLKDVIVREGAELSGYVLSRSVIGKGGKLKGPSRQAYISDRTFLAE